ncbi:hypothetical protein [Microbacterium sp. CFBP9034]|uniref:hypothetical protein n=1 Tax=Microbacterium sp. CFBP9034 TaxID=3096540 RepID=UPI002A6B09DD|nr:hypothetical protein [Microbacterium sp. CFBP9034]MDY0910692.1 hypothetical protein [Microbacterium sp. CFBP9034]
MSDTIADVSEAPAVTRSTLAHWACAAIGVAAALLGLLPWLGTGMRLPLQNLWAVSTMPEDMPLVALPFSQYYLSQLFGLLVTGSVVAGIAARATRARLPRGGFGLLVFGLLIIQVGATAQSAVTVRAGLQDRTESTLYLVVVVAVCALSIAVGAGVVALVARAPRAGALLGLTIGSLAAGAWLSAVLRPLTMMSSEGAYAIVTAVQWVPPVLVGVAIAWAGLNTVGRVVAALASLVLLWIVPALITGVTSAAGSRVLAHEPQQMIEYAVQVFSAALLLPELAMPPVLVAVVVAAMGLGVRWVVARRRSRAQL